MTMMTDDIWDLQMSRFVWFTNNSDENKVELLCLCWLCASLGGHWGGAGTKPFEELQVNIGVAMRAWRGWWWEWWKRWWWKRWSSWGYWAVAGPTRFGKMQGQWLGGRKSDVLIFLGRFNQVAEKKEASQLPPGMKEQLEKRVALKKSSQWFIQ